MGASGGQSWSSGRPRDRAAVLRTLGNDIQRGVKAEACCFSSNGDPKKWMSQSNVETEAAVPKVGKTKPFHYSCLSPCIGLPKRGCRGRDTGVLCIPSPPPGVDG